jgi:hypothetical protein
MDRFMKIALVAVAAVALVACGGSTSFNTTWTAPDAGRLSLDDGTKVIAMVVTDNTAKRRGFETALVSELNGHGLDAVAAYTVVPEDAAKDSEKARPYIQKTGASYALVLQVTGTDQQITGTPSMTTAGMWHGPRQFWGPTWGGWGWGWTGGTDIRTDTIVRVQSLLYDLGKDELVWAGQSETMNPSKAESFMREMVRSIGNELQKEGLVGPAK